MRPPTELVLVLSLLLGLPTACGPASEPPPPESGDAASSRPEVADATAAAEDLEATARATVQRFKAALASGDSAAVLALLHPEVRVFESGHAETAEEYRAGHLPADMEFLAGVEAATTWERLTATDGLALYESTYQATGRFRDREIDVRGVETLVLTPVDGEWRIRHIHWSSR